MWMRKRNETFDWKVKGREEKRSETRAGNTYIYTRIECTVQIKE